MSGEKNIPIDIKDFLCYSRNSNQTPSCLDRSDQKSYRLVSIENSCTKERGVEKKEELERVIDAFITGSYFESMAEVISVSLHDLVEVQKYTRVRDRRYLVSAHWWRKWCDFINIDSSKSFKVDLKTCQV